jgi:Mrp family chromosome partitioning ATPase
MKLFGRRKPTAPELLSEGLTLRTEDGKTLATFTPDVVTSFRHMVTERAYQDGLPARIAMIAALRGEGVSYTTLAFATTLASDMAVKVCVVELNWWYPDLLRKLGREPSAGQAYAPGLADVLDQTASFDTVVIKTDNPNLHLLPAGDLPLARRHSGARSSALRDAIDELSQRYDHLILDLPAVLDTSDAIALINLSNACCIVVRQGVTRSASVKQALDYVKHMPILGVILNQSSFYTPRWLLNLIPQE